MSWQLKKFYFTVTSWSEKGDRGEPRGFSGEVGNKKVFYFFWGRWQTRLVVGWQ